MTTGKKLAIRYIRAKFRLLSSVSKLKAAQKAFDLFCTPQYRNKKKLPPVFEKAEKLHISFEGHRVNGYRFNHPGKARVLIAHGFESTVLNFDQYIKPLVKKGYEVLAFDAPAHGHSPGRMIDVLLYKRMLHYIHSHLGPVKGFMGHSLGGLALSLFLEETEHDASTQLVLIAPATETTTAIDNFFKFLKLDEGVRKEFEKILYIKGGHEASWYSVARALGKIKARVLFLQDQDDDMTPLSDVEPLIRKKHSHIKFIISKGLGHSRIYREPATIRAVSEFFDNPEE